MEMASRRLKLNIPAAIIYYWSIVFQRKRTP